MISLSRHLLEMELAQLESGVVHKEIVLRSIRDMISKAPLAVPFDLAKDMAQEIESFSRCRVKIHGKWPCECRRCRIFARWERVRLGE